MYSHFTNRDGSVDFCWSNKHRNKQWIPWQNPCFVHKYSCNSIKEILSYFSKRWNKSCSNKDIAILLGYTNVL